MIVGIIGAGQLGRMLALAGYPLGLRFRFLDANDAAPGAQVGDIVLGAFDDAERVRELAASVDMLTFDVENVPADVVREATRGTPFLPPVAALETGQDRLAEKTLFNELDIPTPAFRAVDTARELRVAADELGLPAVLKTRRLGYDGRGQVFVRDANDLDAGWRRLREVPCILETLVPFDKEVSVIGARSTRGEIACYPLAENVHEDGILRFTTAPAGTPALQALARQYLERVLERFDYAGVLTIEFFVCGAALLANEIAPRVHNSGHWTIEGAVCSQFENHLRAILGLPLGRADALGHSGMVNFLGAMPPRDQVLRLPGAHYHDYGKTPRPARKLGHATVVAATPEGRDAGVRSLLEAGGRADQPRMPSRP